MSPVKPADIQEPPKQAAYQDPTLPPQPPPYGQVVVTTQPIYITQSQRFHLVPVRTSCKNCHADIVTNIDYRVGLITWIACGAIILLGCIFGCCLFPFCFSASKDAYHTCPNCKEVLGVYKRM